MVLTAHIYAVHHFCTHFGASTPLALTIHIWQPNSWDLQSLCSPSQGASLFYWQPYAYPPLPLPYLCFIPEPLMGANTPHGSLALSLFIYS